MKLKFKVGDIVKIRADLKDYEKEYCGAVYVNDDMANLAGHVATITGVNNGDNYHIDLDDGDWNWSDDTFEEIAPIPLNQLPADVLKLDTNKPQHKITYHVGEFKYDMYINLAEFTKDNGWLVTDNEGRPFIIPNDWVDSIVRI